MISGGRAQFLLGRAVVAEAESPGMGSPMQGSGADGCGMKRASGSRSVSRAISCGNGVGRK